jgi:extradiol dioxygenase family protein
MRAMALLRFIDHVAITVADVDRTTRFYDQACSGPRFPSTMRRRASTLVRTVIIGGAVRINVHQQGNGIDLVADRPTPGSVDICFRFGGSIKSRRRRC